MQQKIKTIFFGTPEFAAPALKALIKADFIDLKLVITQPDKPIGRHHSKPAPSPVKKLALENNIDIFNENIKNFKNPYSNEKILGIVVAYGQIFSQELIDSFSLGIINIHPSLLPKYRGSSPIQTPILNQDKETGTTIMKLDAKMDHGPIIAQEKIKLNGSETGGFLHDNLSKLGADLLIKILPNYISGKINLKEQEHKKATYTNKLSKKDGRISWSLSPQKAEAFIRAMNPWPGAWTTWNNKKIIIWKTKLENNKLIPQEIQIEGKKKMTFVEFLKGHQNFKLTDCV